MKLLPKLTLLAIGVSALPLAIAGYSSLYIGQGALRGAIEENELTVAKQVAGYAESHIDNLLSILRVDAKIFDLTRSSANEGPSPQALLKFLQLVYHQSDDFCAAAMFDEHGTLDRASPPTSRTRAATTPSAGTSRCGRPTSRASA